MKHIYLTEYSTTQVKEAAKFIVLHNSSIKDSTNQITMEILSSIGEVMMSFPKLNFISTMGYTVIGWSNYETIYHKDITLYKLFISILVDPAISIENKKIVKVKHIN